jgi:4-hydroxy-tetrahydrodipicolinate synthase
MSSLRGVFPVFQMPYHDDESIDFTTLDRELEWLIEMGVDGLVMAMVSEVLRLATDEREDVAQRVCRRVAGRRPVVISVGAESARVSERLARHAEGAGAHAVMAIPPVCVAAVEDEILRYYECVIHTVTVPVIVQDASAYVGRPLSLSLQARMLEAFGERVYFKPEAHPLGPNLSALRDATAGRARVFEGSGGIALVDNYRRGVVGTMPAADLIDGIVALWKALEAGQEQRAYQIALPIGAIIALQTNLDAYLAIEKYLLVKRGLFENTRVRGPVGYRLDDETRREIDRLFDLLLEALKAPNRESPDESKS